MAVLEQYEYDANSPVTSISRQNLIDRCQISGKEFDTVIQEANFEKYLKIYEIYPNQFVSMKKEMLFDLLDELILLINDESKNLDYNALTAKKIMEANDGVIKA